MGNIQNNNMMMSLYLIEYNHKFLCKKVEELDPWVKFAGIFKDDPLFDEFVEDMATYRRELDAKIAADEINSEEN